MSAFSFDFDNNGYKNMYALCDSELLQETLTKWRRYEYVIITDMRGQIGTCNRDSSCKMSNSFEELAQRL